MKKLARLAESRLTSQNEISFERKKLNQPSTVHWHDFYELDIILSGHGRTFINGQEHTFQEGTVVFMSPSDFHDFYSDEVEIFNIHFSEESVDSELLHTLIHLNSRISCLDDACMQSMMSLCSLCENVTMGKAYRKLYYKKLLESMLILFLQGTDDEKYEASRSEPDIIQQIVIYANTHFAENPMLKDIADAFHMNENYLCSLFKRYMGENYKSYIRKLKLTHAEKLISFTNLSVTEIALNCGYNTLSHFNREFKSMFHVTPLERRKMFRT